MTTPSMDRRGFLRSSTIAMAAVGGMAGLLSACGDGDSSNGSGSGPIKLALATDLTGAYAGFGMGHRNVAELAVKQINDGGGLLGREVSFMVVDTASSTDTATERVTQLLQKKKPDVVMGGLSDATTDALAGVVAGRNRTLYVHPMQNGGSLVGDRIFGTGNVPSQYIVPLVDYLMDEGAERFYLPGSDYGFPRDSNAWARAAVEARGGTIVGEEYFPLDASTFGPTVNKIISTKADVVLNTVIPPGFTTFLAQLHDAGFLDDGGRLACPFMDDTLTGALPAEHYEGLASCWEWWQSLDTPFDQKYLAAYNKAYPDGPPMSGAATGMYRAVMLWADAVRSADAVDADSVSEAFDSASVSEGPGGGSSMAPGTGAPNLHMYVGVAKSGKFTVAKDVGMVAPVTGGKIEL